MIKKILKTYHSEEILCDFCHKINPIEEANKFTMIGARNKDGFPAFSVHTECLIKHLSLTLVRQDK